MAKQLNQYNVTLGFSADTNKVKAQLQDLQNQLSKLTLETKGSLGIEKEIQSAVRAAAELSSHLKAATNVNTGTLDFTKLNRSIQQSGTSLQNYGKQLQSLGPAGEKAFLSLAQAVASSEVPIRRSNALLKEFGTTLANTARWQFSSSMLHSLMGAMQSAYGYAQDLNESLNNIRIVTGQNVDQMAKFAQEANKAARALSATTTEYTNASLIYYQQGLNDQQVKERTDITIKMANVARQSAEIVSDQMTAVWNNFYDGSKSLEHYADVMTALGAATASSTDEIAEGLNKFAAVADTVGLSYEYAASALATVTATTRQSADVVGTAFKTLFARIQDLELGKTLDDGTTLGKYSQALANVGVQIKDVQGNMKTMDVILDEMASKWDTLGKAEQIALAQSVAGVRQYTQLIALMDNWDFMEQNLSTSNASAGALQKQAEIYGESWEAARDRVKAAAESIYGALLNDKFFIGIYNGFEKTLNLVDKLIDNVGGLKGVLNGLGVIVTKIFSKQLSQGLTNLVYNLKMSTDIGRIMAQNQRNTFIEESAKKMQAIPGEATPLEEARQKSMRSQLTLQSEYLQNQERMSALEQDTNKMMMDRVKTLREQVVELQTQREMHAEIVQSLSQAVKADVKAYNDDNEAKLPAADTYLAQMRQASDMMATFRVTGESALKEIFANTNNAATTFEAFKKSLLEVDTSVQIVGKDGAKAFEEVRQSILKLDMSDENLKDSFAQITQQLADIIAKSQFELKDGMVSEGTRQKVDVLAKAYLAKALAQKRSTQASREANATEKETIKTIREATGAQSDLADTFIKTANILTSLNFAANSLDGILDDLTNPDTSGWEKFTNVLSRLAIFLSTILNIWRVGKEIINKETLAKIANTTATAAQTYAERELAKAKRNSADATKENTKETNKNTAAKTWDTLTDAQKGQYRDIVSKDKKIFGRTIYKAPNFKQEAEKEILTQNGYDITKDGRYLKKGQSPKHAKTASEILNNSKNAQLASDAKALEASKLDAAAASRAGAVGKAGSLGAKLGGLAIAAVVIAGAVQAVKQLNEIYNANEIAAQKAEQAAKNLADSYSNVKTEYDELLNTMSNYDSIVDSIDGMIRGTNEFTMAIANANDEALKLLNTYGDIIGDRTSVDGDGLITINQDALDDIKAQELNKVQKAQSASIIANQQARDARLTADVTELNRKQMKTSEGFTGEDANRTGAAAATGMGVGAGAAAIGLAAGGSAALAGAGIGASLGSFLPVVGTLIGAAVGLGIGALTGAIVNAVSQNSETDAEKVAFEKLSQNYLELGESAITKDKIAEAYGIAESEVTDEQIAAIKELCQELRSNTLATEAENKAMAGSILSDNEKVQQSQYAEDVATFAGAAYTKSQSEAYKKYMDTEMADFWDVGTEEGKKNWARYAKAQGLDKLTGYAITDYRKDGGVEYSYKDENGETQKKIITAEEIASVLAAEDADTATNEAGEKIVKILDNLDEATVNILSGAKSKDMSNLTMGQLSGDIKAIEGMSEEDLQTLGFEGTKNEILESIKAQQQANINNIKLYANEYGGVVSELMNSLIDSNDTTLRNVTQGTLKAYTDTLGELAAHGGAEVMKNFDAGLQGIMDKNSKYSDQIMSLANDIDWSKGEDALQEFNYQLIKMGINIDRNSTEWQSLVQAAQNINVSVVHRDLDTLRAQLVEIKDICDDIEIGDIISDEEFDKLIQHKAELADLFIMTADGYRYIGGGDLNQLSTDAALEQLKKTKEQNDAVKKTHSAINAWGWSTEEGFKKEDWYGLANGTDSNQSMSSMAKALVDNNADQVKALGFDSTRVSEWADAIVNGTPEQIEAARSQLQKFYSTIVTMNTNMENDVYSDNIAEQIAASTATTIDQLNQMSSAFEGGKSSEVYTKQLQYLTNSGIMAAESLADLYSIVNQGLDNGATVDYYTYAQGLLNVAEQYDNVTSEIGRYKEALETGNQKTIAAAQDQLEAAISAGEMAEQYGLTAEHIERYADELKSSQQYSNANEKALTNMAKDQLRFDRAVNTATEHMEDWNKDLKVAEKTGHLVSETADEMASAYGDLLDIDGSELSADFLKNTTNLENMKKALEGDEEAYRALQEAARLDIAARVGLDDSQFQTDFANLMATCEMPGLSDIEVGTSLDNQAFLDGLSEMVTKAGMTAQEATDYLSSMGVDAEVVNEPQTIEEIQGYNLEATAGTISVPYMGAASDGSPMPLEASYPTVSYEAVPVTTEKTIAGTALKVTSASKSSGGGVKHAGSTTAAGGSNATKPSGGGNKTKSKDLRKKKVDMVDRYKPINDKMDDMADKLDDASKAADRLWGTARIKQMQKVNSILEDEIELIKEKKSEAEAYLVSDKNALNEAAAAMNVAFTYDKNGNITNYESQLTELWKTREDLISSFGEEASDEQKKQLDEFDKDFENLKSLLSQYDETRELIEDLENDERDKKYEIQDNNFEMLNEGLEIKVQFNEDELEKLDYYIDKLDGDFYMMAEAYGELSKKGDIYKASLADQSDYFDQLKEKYANNEISQAAYIEGLQNANDAILSNLQSLQDLDDEMTEYYSNTLNAASDELSKYTDKMEHLSSVLDHYSSVMDLLGKSKDYEVMGSILEGQAHTARNELDAAKATYALYDAEVRHWEDLMSQATTDDEMEVYKKNWEAAKTAANDAQEAILSKTESWAEAMKAVVQNNMDELNQSLEEALTGGFDFDTMLNSMERASSLQEEYLTTTNKIYETNKLMRTAQQEIDKSTNSVAKRRLTQFINETEQLQNQTKLSNYELEIQQAKYDLLLAEIALEEAQNAKSTVRLQRDAEGNFGYVYTADQDKVAQAQQELEDAQNSLYNIGLEGANDYSQKYAETMQEMYDTMAELQQAYLDGEIATQEEYDAKMLAAKEYYFNKLKDYSNLYQVALTTDTRVINDAWSSDFNDMIYKTNDLQKAVNDYTQQSAEILMGWSTTVKNALSETGLDDIDDQVKAVTDESDKLKETLIGTDGKSGVVKAIQDEILEVNNLSGAYAKVREKIQLLVEDYEDLMTAITDAQKTEEEAAKKQNQNADNNTDKTNTDQQSESEQSDSETSAAGQYDAKTKAGVALSIIRNATAAGWGNGSTRKKNLEAKGFSYNEIQGLVNTYFGNSQALIAANGINWPSDYSKYVMSRFNTGGYTGSWGSYGKLGILDEKELVLNQGDTANFLASMEVLERILQVIDLHSMNAQLGGLLSSPSYGGNNNETTIEQNVHIEASFPGVSDRNEIEEAFNNLVNQASQYANRK